MIYSDQENRRWWNGLSKQDQSEIFDRILETVTMPKVREFYETLVQIWERGSQLSDANLANLRKWDR